MFENKRIHMIGIGGISMSGIAQLLINHKAIISGSDMQNSEIIQKLQDDGIKVQIGHHPEMIKDADIIIYTAAIKDDDPERLEAKNLKKEMYERAEFLGLLTKEYKNCICISGTHGKSTTTGMVSLAFIEANLNPTIHIGAILNQINGNTKIGSKDYLILESCEYVDSFLHFHPTSEIVLNIDNDHLDYFKNLENIQDSFEKFVDLLPNNGILIKNNDDENSKLINNYNGKTITYAIEEDALYTARDITYTKEGFPKFYIFYKNEPLISISLKVYGYHNIYNALATFALCHEYINDINKIKKGIEAYTGIKRRFEFIGNYNESVKVYDDYAHHPTELETTLNSVRKVEHNESWAVFQAHTFSRTKEHYKRFAKILSNFDHIIIAKIYPARETNTFNITENMIIEEIKLYNENAIYIEDFHQIVEYIKSNVQENDLVITIGAGPINQIGLELLDKK